MKRRAILDQLEPYVPGKRIEGGVKLASNENPFGPAPAALEAFTASFADVHRYPDGGMHALKAALAARCAVTPDQLVIGNGSDEIMVMIAGAFIEPDTNAVTAAHTFSQYTFATSVFGGSVRHAAMREGTFDLGAISDLIDESTRIVWLCNPNNPTGTMFSHNDLARFLKGLTTQPIVVVDEAYAEFVEDGSYPDTLGLIRNYPNLIRLRTFSKIYGLAALRVGYGIAESELIEAVTTMRQPFNVGTPAQNAARAALADEAHIQKTKANNRTERARLYRWLEERGIPYYPTQANFVCAEFGERAAGLVSALEERGISVRPLGSFSLPNHLRISIGTPDEMDALYEAVVPLLEADHASR
ncbi:MAG: histidinol-phosphate transaminase [Spirochaetota bacterium]